MYKYYFTILLWQLSFVFAQKHIAQEDLDHYLVSKRLTIDFGSRESTCFFQHLDIDYEVYVLAKVVGQANHALGLEIISNDDHVLFPYKFGDEISHKFKTSENGDYRFCLQNSNFATSRITLLVHALNVAKYEEQLNKLKLASNSDDDFARSFAQLMQNVASTANYMMYLNQHSLKDTKLIESNFYYINVWSTVQSVAILCVGFVQIYALKKLFLGPQLTPSGKPRA